MQYNFDEVIDRRHTNAMSVEGFRPYMFPEQPDIELPVADEDLIRMWVADMDFAVAPEIIQAIHARVDQRIFGYTAVCEDSYFEAFARWCRDRYDWEVPREQIAFSLGIVPALYQLVGMLTAPDEKVLFVTPAYGYFLHAAEFNHRETVFSPLRNRDGYFTVDAEDLARKAADPKVKVLIWCNPHNPTGRVWTWAEAETVARIAMENDLWLISDEIHCDILRNGQTHIPMGKVMPDYPKLITCMSASKTFNLAGMMLSHIIIPDPALRRSFLDGNAHGRDCNPLSVAAFQAAYEKGWPWLSALRTYLDENFAFASAFIEKEMSGARCPIPQATYLAWVDMNDCLPDVEDLSKFFATRAGVLLEGGNKLFADNARGFLRLNLAMPRSVVETGLQRMADAVRACRG